MQHLCGVNSADFEVICRIPQEEIESGVPGNNIFARVSKASYVTVTTSNRHASIAMLDIDFHNSSTCSSSSHPS